VSHGLEVRSHGYRLETFKIPHRTFVKVFKDDVTIIVFANRNEIRIELITREVTKMIFWR
jgi:hypothetical protein